MSSLPNNNNNTNITTGNSNDEEYHTNPPKLFHSGKILRERRRSRHYASELAKWPYPTTSKSSSSSLTTTINDTSSRQIESKTGEESHSEEGYWQTRTRKLIAQHQAMNKTNTEIYGRVVMMHQQVSNHNNTNNTHIQQKENKTTSITQAPKENIANTHNNNEENHQHEPTVVINAQLFKGLVFFFNSIRGEGIHSQYHLTKLATIHGAIVL